MCGAGKKPGIVVIVNGLHQAESTLHHLCGAMLGFVLVMGMGDAGELGKEKHRCKENLEVDGRFSFVQARRHSETAL